MRDTEPPAELRFHRPADGAVARQVPGTDGLQDGLSLFRAKPRSMEGNGPSGKILDVHARRERTRSHAPETRAQNIAKYPLSPIIVRRS